jgi:flavin-dependent dehydrogenase
LEPPVNARATLDLRDACEMGWDALVIGAGPAGSATARLLALEGLRTLLVEAKPFPRFKVCGGCLNQRALDTLDRLGLRDVVVDAGGAPLAEVQFVVGSRRLTLGLPSAMALSRQALDQRLVDSASAAGVRFLWETRAKVQPGVVGSLRQVIVHQGGRPSLLRAKVVVCADGIARSSVRHLRDLAPRVASRGRVGVGAVIDSDRLSKTARERFAHGRIVMHVAAGGYVGAAPAEHGKTLVAAALDRDFLKRHGSPRAAVGAVLATTGLTSLGDTSDVSWQGTPVLTSHARHVAAERLLLIGDAAGYVEPFTGEGIAWAIESAVAAAPLAAQGCEAWTPALAAGWEGVYRRRIRRGQWACHLFSAMLRRPWAVSLALGLARGCPAAADRIVSRFHQPLPASVPT